MDQEYQIVSFFVRRQKWIFVLSLRRSNPPHVHGSLRKKSSFISGTKNALSMKYIFSLHSRFCTLKSICLIPSLIVCRIFNNYTYDEAASAFMGKCPMFLLLKKLTDCLKETLSHPNNFFATPGRVWTHAIPQSFISQNEHQTWSRRALSRFRT